MQPSWRRPPRIVAHRGSARAAPENTLASFRQAVVEGARAIELDVRLTRDGEVVVHHDATLGRTLPGEGAIEDALAAELFALDAGVWFAPRFAGERLPTLAQVFEALPLDVLVDVEIKADALNAEALPARVAEIVEDHDALERVLVTSFDGGLASDYAARAGRPAGLLLSMEPDEGDLADWPLLATFSVHHDALRPDALAMLLDAGKTVLAWTVNDAARARALLDGGVAGVITDVPGEMLAALGARI